MRVSAILFTLMVMLVPNTVNAFFDDFNDGDISDWEPRCAPGVWQPTTGMVYGSTGTTPAVLAPVAEYSVENCEIEVSVKGGHAHGMIARLTDGDTGVIAYISPDHDVARIRVVSAGGLSTILSSMDFPVPDNEWFDLTFILDGPNLTFHIHAPSTGDTWTLTAIDPNPQPGNFGLLMGDEPGALWDWISVSDVFGDVSISWLQTDDVAWGNGNMAFEAGEGVELGIQLLNQTESTLVNAFAIIQSLDTDIQVTQDRVDFGNIPAGESTWGSNTFGLLSSSGAPEGEVYGFLVSVFADGGYNDQLDLELPLGSGVSTDVESMTEGWTFDLVEPGWANNWHYSSARNHTPSGSQSFKCGDIGGGDYDTNVYAYVSTPLFNTPLTGSMTFWMWIDAHYPSAQDAALAFDGGLLQYGRCGTWIDMIPTGGYPYEIAAGSSGPFEDGTGVFSGYAGWELWSVIIPDSLAGPGQVRFVFGSDASGTREGWYIDDVNITGSTRIVEEGFISVNGPDLRIWPNPFFGSLTFTVSGMEDGPLSMEVYDLSGRLLASPEFEAGGSERSLLWDGRCSDGSTIPAGIYITRLSGTDPLVRTLVKL